VSVSYAFSFITPIGSFVAMFGGSDFGPSTTLMAQGVEPCET
jgi:hypothetical protein